MQVLCPRCGQPIPGVDIDLTTQSAVCRPCGEITSLATLGTKATVALPTFGPPQAGPAPPAFGVEAFGAAPAGLYRPADLSWAEVNDSPGTWSVTITPPRAAAFGLLFFAVFWDGFLVFWYGAAASAKHAPLVMFLFPLLHVGAGVLITHSALCGLLNRMMVRLSGDVFEFRRGPIPQGGAVREPAMNIAGFEATQTRGAGVRSRGRQSQPTWGVHLLTRDRRSIPVKFGFLDPAHADYAAGRLSQMLEEARQGVTYRG